MVFGFLRFGVFGVLGFWGLGFRVLGFIGFRFWGLGVLVDFLGRCKFLLGGFCFIFLIGSGIFFGLWLDMRFFLMNFLKPINSILITCANTYLFCSCLLFPLFFFIIKLK